MSIYVSFIILCMSHRMFSENLLESHLQMTTSQIIHLYIMDGGCTQKVKIYILSSRGERTSGFHVKQIGTENIPVKLKVMTSVTMLKPRNPNAIPFQKLSTLRSPHTTHTSRDQELASCARPAKSSPPPVW